MQSRRFQIPPGLKSVFEKCSFRDGLVWTVDLTGALWTGLSRIWSCHVLFENDIAIVLLIKPVFAMFRAFPLWFAFKPLMLGSCLL